MHSIYALAPYLMHLEQLSFWGVVLVVAASGHIIPLPEAATLILLGYLVALGHMLFWKVTLGAAVAALIIDLGSYLIALGGGTLARRLTTSLDTSLVTRYEQAEERHLFLLVLASHFVPGWRFANPLICGVTDMPWKKFVLYTVISIIIYIPALILLGLVFHATVLPVIALVESLRRLLFEVLLLLILVFLVRHISRPRGEKKV